MDGSDRTTGGILFEDGQVYKVRLEGFEGPLDLLLHLIRKNRFDVYDIPIAAILQEYLGVLEVMRELDLDVAGEFLVMAATLAHIKSRLLLPVPQDEDVEEGEDPRAELVRRLVEYERIRIAAAELEHQPVLGRDVFARTWRAADLDEVEVPDAPVEADLFELLQAFRELMAEAPEEVVHQVARQRVSLQEAMSGILEQFAALPAGMGVSFRELFPPRSSRDRVIATFLGLLELVRLRAIRVMQVAVFGELRVYGVPTEGEESPPASDTEE